MPVTDECEGETKDTMKTLITHPVRILRMFSGMLVALAMGTAWATDIYVSSTGSVTAPYDAWTNAFTTVQAAFDFVQTNAGVANIYLAGQTFAAAADGTKVYALASVANLAIRGGYEANPYNPTIPGPRNPIQWPTALARSGTTAGRVITLSGLSNVTFEGVTIRGGSYNPGGGIHVSTSSGGVTFENCIVSNNYANVGQGGAFYITTSTVTLTNSLVQANKGGRGNDGTQARGGAAYLAASGVMNVFRSTIANNTALSSRQQPSYGGAVDLEAATAELNVWESVITNNMATTEWAGGTGRGGAIYNNGGKVRLRNVLLSRNATALTGTDASSGIMSLGTAPYVLLENCTVADNDAGKAGSVALRRSTGVFAVTNSIMVNHVTDLFNFNLDHVGYSNIGDGQNAGFLGCHSVDPHFADTRFYHLKSTAGHFAGGAFSGGSWTTAAVNSPLIDRGDPASAYGLEPAPNGGRVNMGAYGNTDVAAKTPTVTATLPAISNPGVGFRSHTVANLSATLTDDGGQLPDVAFHYWESGTTATNTVPAGMREEGTFIWPVGGLVSGLTYEYRVSAANGAGTAWSGVSSFSMLPVNATIYVSSSGDNSDASTWATAYTDPTVAFASAESGDTIRLAGETFAAAPGFALNYVYLVDGKSNLRVEGGYQASGATPGSRDPAKWPTILKRSTGSASVLRIQNSPNIVVEGVTITGGSYFQGGGVHLSGATQSAWLENCIITNNLLPAAGNATDGGAGVLLASGTAVITNCLVLGNKIVSGGLDNYYGPGGGVRVSGGTMTIRNSTIASNVAQGNNKNTAAPYNRGADGGGIYVGAGAVLDIAESVVTNNSALQGAYACWTRGGGIANVGGTARLRNVLIAGNTTSRTENDPSGGIYSRETAAKTHLESCTVVSNDFNEATAVGVRYAAGTLSITNSIVWGHAAGDLSNLPVDGAVLRNVGWSLFNDAAMDGVAGCISADPLFRNPGMMDFTLQDGRHGAAGVSPAIDSGLRLPWMKGAVDLAGGKRLQSGAVDMGAYEAAGARALIILIR